MVNFRFFLFVRMQLLHFCVVLSFYSCRVSTTTTSEVIAAPTQRFMNDVFGVHRNQPVACSFVRSFSTKTMMEYFTKKIRIKCAPVKRFCNHKNAVKGPWWSSGQHARLHSDGWSSNPADPNSFSVKFVFENNENKQKYA